MNVFRLSLVIMLFLQLATGCASGGKAAAPVPLPKTAPGLTGKECAYFYFLWGTHAKDNQHFTEAQKAYEKALACDPGADYIRKKLPLLLIRMGKTAEATRLLETYINRHPEDVSEYMLLAHLKVKQNKIVEATKLYREVLRRDPGNEDVLLGLGILYSRQKKLGEAETIFQGLLKKNPELYFAHLYLARVQHLRGDDRQAAKSYEEALQLNWSPDLVYEIAEFYSKQKRYEDALQLYSTVIANDPTDQRAAFGRIQALLNLGRDKQALEELQEVRGEFNDTNQIDMVISKIMLRLGRTEDAKKILLRLKGDKTGPEADYLLGLIDFQAGDLSSALNHLKAIKPDAEQYTEAIYLQVRIYHQRKQIQRAITLLNSSLADPLHLHPIFYSLLSSLYKEEGEKEKAMASLTAGIAAFPKNAELYFEQALLLEDAGLHLEAAHTMQRVLQLNPNHAEALNFIGYTWADHNINLDKAYRYISKAVDLKPDNGFIRDSLGWVYFRMGRLEQALHEMKKAVQLEPDDPHIREHLGDVCRAMGRTEQARTAYRKALQLAKEASEKAELQKKIDALDKP